MTENIYEFSFALSEEQGLEGAEHGLLGRMMIVMGEYVNQVSLERMAVVIEHLRQVNDFLIKNPDQVLPKPVGEI
jgi:hypothetical protein